MTYNFQGWLTAFCFFDNHGHKAHREDTRSECLELDGTQYGGFDVKDVPNGWCSVPVRIGNNGIDIHTTMVAGSVGIKVTSSVKDLHGLPGQTGPDTISPIVGWWLFGSEKEEPEAKTNE